MPGSILEHPPSSGDLCLERGIGPDFPGRDRLLRYSGISLVIARQFAEKTGEEITEEVLGFLADLNLAGAIFDDITDQQGPPNWEVAYEPNLFGQHQEQPAFLSRADLVPEELTASWRQNLASLNTAHRERIARSWDGLVGAMYELKDAATAPPRSPIQAIVSNRVAESVALSRLYVDVLSPKELEPGSGVDRFLGWLSLEITAGNVIDLLFDYQEDVKSGHREWSLGEKIYVLARATGLSAEFLVHPLTSRGDVSLMLGKLAKHYLCLPSLSHPVPSKSSI